MQDRREACTVLGFSEEVSREEIENRYFYLMKKYKNLAEDERPTPGEPVFAAINEAYRFLIGYAPLQKVQFQELTWKEKVRHIRDNYIMEITFTLAIVLFVCIVGTGIHELYKAVQAASTGVYSPIQSPLPISQDRTTNDSSVEVRNR
jgi:hypothetical protein